MIKTKKNRINTKTDQKLFCRQRQGRRWRQACIAIYGLAAAASLYYVICVNKISVQGFELYELKLKKENGAVEVKKLESAVIATDSLRSISKRAAKLGFVKLDKVEYLKVNDEMVARLSSAMPLD